MSKENGRRLYIEECGNGYIFEVVNWNPERDIWESPKPRYVSQDKDIAIQFVEDFLNEKEPQQAS